MSGTCSRLRPFPRAVKPHAHDPRGHSDGTHDDRHPAGARRARVPREPPSRAALAVAERLGTGPVALPGNHGGFRMNTEAFAAKLDEVLEVTR
jgi:hypothetical protein